MERDQLQIELIYLSIIQNRLFFTCHCLFCPSCRKQIETEVIFCYYSPPIAGASVARSQIGGCKWQDIFVICLCWPLLCFFSIPAAGIAAEKAADPCSLLTQAEIQETIGKPVQPGKLKAHATPAAGADCNYIVGDFGSFNVLIKPLQSGETPERIKAQFAKMKMTPVDLPNVGDSSFFTSPGFNMVQLQTFKGSKYILFTMLVPGLEEPAVRPMAATLMRELLPRL